MRIFSSLLLLAAASAGSLDRAGNLRGNPLFEINLDIVLRHRGSSLGMSGGSMNSGMGKDGGTSGMGNNGNNAMGNGGNNGMGNSGGDMGSGMGSGM
jgi:hypothetical protein